MRRRRSNGHHNPRSHTAAEVLSPTPPLPSLLPARPDRTTTAERSSMQPSFVCGLGPDRRPNPESYRYHSSADWGLIDGVARRVKVPIIGNGDVVTHYEANRHFQREGVHGIMTGRGALIKPWLFQEFCEGQTLDISVEDRILVYRQLARYMREHFGDDAWGRQKAFYFLPWHLGFFFRYRYLPHNTTL